MNQKSLCILIKCCTLISIVFISLSCSIISNAESSDKVGQENWRTTKQQIWWYDDELVKNAVLSVITLKMNHPELLNEVAYDDFFSSTIDLLLLFDSMESNRSLETLASLSSYYLGAHGGEIYSCLLLRKGEKIKPLLMKLLNSNNNECLDKFKDIPVVGTSGAIVSACMSDEVYRKRLKALLANIDKNEWCVIEE